jgi:hypothetical protein
LLVIPLLILAAALALAPRPALAVSGASFTSVDESVDGIGHCLAGNPNVNCNTYDGKQFVWMNGGPATAGLADGTYFFAVVQPSGQANPNDGSPDLLSADTYDHRTFTVTNGVIAYPTGSGQHDQDGQLIRLAPYIDTSNPGGVYIMAVCSLPNGVQPVAASNCKYDAFKVQTPEGGVPGPGLPLTIMKDATGSYNNTFTWGIQKSVDRTLVRQSDTTATFNYTVAVTHDSGKIGGVTVTGTISVVNPNSDPSSGATIPVTIDGVTDQLSDGTNCTVTNGGSQALTQFETDFAYTCDLGALPQGEIDNTATVTWSPQDLSDGSSLAAGTANFTFSNIAFTETKVDDCVTVTDPLAPADTFSQVCSTAPSPTTFTYPYTVTGTPGTCVPQDNTATFTTNTTGTTGSDSKSVQLCVGADLSVSKTATPSFTRTFKWNITKSVDQTLVKQSGTTATFNYTVSVSHDGGTDNNWQVNGDITVTNPNNWEPITADVTDAVNDGGTCTVSAGTTSGTSDGSGGIVVLVTASGRVDLPYTCTYTAAPNPLSGTNTATAAWNSSTAATPDGSAHGQAGFTFNDGTTGNPTMVDDCVTVTDTLGGKLGQVCAGGDNPTVFPYSYIVTGTPGRCVTQDNTATFTATDNAQVTGSSNTVTVKLCVGADLSVSKTAVPSFTRTYNWNITKNVDKTLVKQLSGAVTFNYTVVATETGSTDSAWAVNGTITVTNPNNWEAITANITDAVNDGGTCTVTGGNVLIAAGQTANLPYTCTYTAAPNPLSGTNTATATWDATAAFTPDSSAPGKAIFDFSTATPTRVNRTITVNDTFNSGTPTPLGTLTATDVAPFATGTYKYVRTVNVVADMCKVYPNIAKILETGQTASQSVTVCGVGGAGALTIGYWQNKNGQGIITGQAATGVCPSATWLRQYAPFQDLSTTATCAQVATYVTNVIKAANASGAAMNAMLKAQMLATALDVYFSVPSLGGNKIGASAPIGGVKIDLTTICHMIDGSGGTATCSGSYENVSSAFGGASSLTVLQMLSYAASQSNVGGSTWYGQVKATQGLAKDAFDAINNQVAFTAP